jgi:hypothetical protein
MAFCYATAKLFYRNLLKYYLLKITSVKDQNSIEAPCQRLTREDFIIEREGEY